MGRVFTWQAMFSYLPVSAGAGPAFAPNERPVGPARRSIYPTVGLYPVVEKESVEEQKEGLRRGPQALAFHNLADGRHRALLGKRIGKKTTCRGRGVPVESGEQAGTPVRKDGCAFFSGLYGGRLTGGPFGEDRAEQCSGNQ